MKVLAAIPARYASTRFPGKLLVELAGRPVIGWTVAAARSATRIDDVAVVTDHQGIAEAARAASARAVVIERPAASGSDRIAHLLEADPQSREAGIVVNVQGDEPLLEPAAIDAAVIGLETAPEADVATLVRPLRPGEDPADPDRVKVVATGSGRALYFSRAPIPHRGSSEDPADPPPTRIHIGLYAYRREAFERFVAAPPSDLERIEQLEQLRALEIGLSIRCVGVESRSIGVDTPADLARAAARLRSPDDPGW